MNKTLKELRNFSVKLQREKAVIPPISLFGEDIGSIIRSLVIANTAIAQSIEDAPQIGNSDYGSRVFVMYGKWLQGLIKDEEFINAIKNI